MNNYRRIYKKYYGSIPKDEDGITYDIHHIDGNHANNNIENLRAVSTQEHFEIHLLQKDWSAAALLGTRLGIINAGEIQYGKMRPGIGGKKRGSVPVNKGNTCFHTSEQKLKWSQKRKGKIHSTRIDKEIIIEIRELFKNKVNFESSEYIGTILKNGKKLTHERAFSKHFSKIYNVTSNHIYNIITKETCRRDA
jgi:hypothetical protein